MSHKAPASVSSDTHPPVGTLIDDDSLELVEVLGVGGYGVVYRALETCTHHPKSYAVKCLVSNSHHSSSRQRQIHIREIALHQIASSHPGVVTLHRVVEEYNRTFIIMDYAPDHDLFTQILHSCRYLGDDALIKHVFLQLLDAVEYCHSLGIYHRDLKPENVLCFDDGLRVAITDFGLATTDKLSEEFRTGSVYHMSPECQGGEFAPTGKYSPMFNDIWSLGIILLNLCTGRNPWKSATSDDQTFRAYLRDPFNFLPTVLPISNELNDILIQMLEVDWRERMTLREVRLAIEELQTFYSDGVVFEGSMARCPWESGMDIDSDSSEDTKETSPPPKSEVDFISRWSKDSTSDIVFARNDSAGSFADSSVYGKPWTAYSSGHATRAVESPSSSIAWLARSATPISPASSGASSLPVTPNNFDMTFGGNAGPPPRTGLKIETNFVQRARYYRSSESMATSHSTGTSMMQTAVDFDPYSSSVFFTSAASDSKASMVLPLSTDASLNDKEMISPSLCPPSATEMTSPSAFSSFGNSVESDSGEMAFTRSEAPSPELAWSEYRSQVQCLPHSPPSQPFPSVYALMTDVFSPSRPSTTSFSSKQSQDSPSRSKASSLFNTVKFFPRSSTPSSPPPPRAAPQPPAGRCALVEPYPPATGNQAPLATPFQTVWAGTSTQVQRSAPIEIPITPQDRRAPHVRSHRHWFMPGKLFAYAGAQ